jgi:hypothetical protein
MRRLMLLLFVAGGCCLFALQAAERRRIEGRILNSATGEPVSGVTLSLIRQGPDPDHRTEESDSSGWFTFEALEPGSYTLLVAKAGFAQEDSKMRSSSPAGTFLRLAAESDLKDVNFKLIPLSTLTGKVVDDEGEPVAGASVKVARLNGVGFDSPRLPEVPPTDGAGKFRISGLRSGRYLILASPRNKPALVPTTETARRDTDKPEQALRPAFYPGVADPASAVLILVGLGQEVSGINIKLRRPELFRIRGRVLLTAPALTMSDIKVRLRPRQGTILSSLDFTEPGIGVKPNADGYFELAGVEPGSYYLIADSASSRGGARGHASVELSRANADNVVLSVGGSTQLSGTARMGGQENTSLKTVRISLVREDGGSISASAQIGSNGSFKIGGVLPGCYVFSVSGLPSTAYLKSVRVGGRDALEGCLDLSLPVPTAAVEVVFSPKVAKVEGIVMDNDIPAPGRNVRLIPDPPRSARRDFIYDAVSDQYGRFELDGVAPGNYMLGAWDERPIGLVLDPEVARQLESRVVRVSVGEGERLKVDVTVTKPEDVR